MRLVELVVNINEQGELVIPADITKKMGFKPKEEATISYVTESNVPGIEENTYKDFYIGKGSLDELEIDKIEEEDMQIRLSVELLKDANISEDADLEIVCQDGKIIIMPVKDIREMIPQELYDLCEEFGVSPNKVDVILRTEQGEYTKI